MNWVDIIIIIFMLIILIGGIAFMVMGIMEDEVGTGIGFLLGSFCFIAFIFGCCFMVIDKGSGSTVGEITSVDKNFFGTTAVYIKANNNSEEEYCVENEKIAKKAEELIGKKVKVTYGKRVGVYSTGRCSEAPLDSIELVQNNG